MASAKVTSWSKSWVPTSGCENSSAMASESSLWSGYARTSAKPSTCARSALTGSPLVSGTNQPARTLNGEILCRTDGWIAQDLARIVQRPAAGLGHGFGEGDQLVEILGAYQRLRELQRDGQRVLALVGIRAYQREAFHLRPLGLDRLAAGLGQLPLRAALAGCQADGQQQYDSPSGHGSSRHEVALAHVRSISRVRDEYRAKTAAVAAVACSHAARVRRANLHGRGRRFRFATTQVQGCPTR